MAAPIMEFYSDRCMPLYLDAYGGRLNRRVSFYGVGAELRDEGPHSFHIVLSWLHPFKDQKLVRVDAIGQWRSSVTCSPGTSSSAMIEWYDRVPVPVASAARGVS